MAKHKKNIDKLKKLNIITHKTSVKINKTDENHKINKK